MKKLIDALQSDGLDALECDYTSGCVRLHLPEFTCCDMRAAIALALHLYPDVEIIRTYSGDKPDINYRRRGDEWQAMWAHKGAAT
jgi:hypothetical protein